MVIPPYTQHKFFFPWSSTFVVVYEDSFLSIYCLFVLNIVIKDSFFVTCNDILEKQVIPLPWKKTYHHHHVVPRAWISLTLLRHFSLLFITSGRSSGLHPISSHSCWMYVRASRPAFARPYVGVHSSTSLMS